MSQVYSTEPSTSGRVVLETTHGPLEIQLWCRECPATVRFFLQLCRDGYYDGLPFHRIVKGFLVQTGLRPEYTSTTEAAKVYLERRSLELHSRIQFNHRGQVAMAMDLSSVETEVEPQFFITLDEAPYLNKQHVVFGTLGSSPTIFNALRIGSSTETTPEGTPVDWENCPKIISTTIHSHEGLAEVPEIVPSPIIPWKPTTTEEPKKKKKKKRKGKRDVNVLSFGNDYTEEEQVGMQSSHDVLSSVNSNKETNKAPVESPTKESTQEPVAKKKRIHDQPTTLPVPSSSNGVSEKTKKPTAHQDVVETNGKAADDSVAVASSKEETPQVSREPTLDTIDANKKTSSGYSAVEAMRCKYKQSRPASKKQREEDTMAKLLAFQTKVRVQQPSTAQSQNQDNSLASRMMAKQQLEREQDNKQQHNMASIPTYHGQVLDGSDEEEGDQSWLSTKFHCRPHFGLKNRGGDGRSMDDYVIHGKRKRVKKHKSQRTRRHDY